MLSFEHPELLFAVLLIIPVLLYLAARISSITRTLGVISASRQANLAKRHIQHSLAVKFTLRALAWIMLVLAGAGISWGSKMVPVQKSGDAVCLVFDISYSMQAADSAGGSTRLEAARLYADALIQRLNNASLGAVLAKGDGVVALPLTEDYAALSALLDSLSPKLMSAAGSSIGRGIKAATGSFPPFSAQAAHIWVFTDGDETDGTIAAALDDAVRFGIPVTFIGFGSTSGADILAGDGKTTVHTVLQEERLKEACQQANKKHFASGRGEQLIRYENALSKGAAVRLLSEIGTESTTLVYEVQAVSRRTLFILIALLLFILSFVAGEYDTSHIKRFFGIALCLPPLLFTSCASRSTQKLHILEASWNWYQKQYHQATAGFLRTKNQAQAEDYPTAALYAQFGLAATYLMQEEYDAASEKLTELAAKDLPPQLKSAVCYNRALIANQRGEYDRAISLFKQAVLADPGNTDAKINLELTDRQRAASQAKSGETEMKQVSEGKDDNTLKKGIFTLIQEQEQAQWKKLQANTKESDSVDY